MASKETRDRTVRLLSQMFRFEGTELVEEWGRLLNGMTDAEVAVAVEYMREKYTSSYAPPFAAFNAWGTGERERSNKRWWQTHDMIETVESQGRAHVLCEAREDGELVPILVPRSQTRPVKHLSKPEYMRRVLDLTGFLPKAPKRDDLRS